MHLFIIRHAQSANNALEDTKNRHYDPDLTELGYLQGDILAQHLANETPLISARARQRLGLPDQGYGITRLYCSAMRRALLTARPVSQALALQAQVWVDIHERGGLWLDHGDEGVRGYPGLTRSELRKWFPDFVIPGQITEAGWWQGGHESIEDVLDRAQRVAAQLCAWSDTDERIAIITHAGFSDNLIKALVGFPQDKLPFLHHQNTAITYLRFGSDNSMHIGYVNRVAHLPSDLLS